MLEIVYLARHSATELSNTSLRPHLQYICLLCAPARNVASPLAAKGSARYLFFFFFFFCQIRLIGFFFKNLELEM